MIHKELAHFLLEKDLLPISLGIYLGTVLQKFLESIVSGLITPSLHLIIPDKFFHIGEDKNSILKKYNFDIQGVINNTLSMILSLVVSYVLVKYIIEKLK